MEAVPSLVAHGPDQAVEIRDGRSVVEELVEERVDGDWVRLGAVTAVVGSDGEGHLESIVSGTGVSS